MKERLCDLRALSDKAKPGPWYVYHPYREDEGESVISTKPKDDPDEYAGRIMNNGDFAASCATLYDEDAEFIAAAVNYVRALLAEPINTRLKDLLQRFYLEDKLTDDERGEIWSAAIRR